ncbi:MAG TPA: DUF2652 domain-containing protein [Anaerolineae bacterium]|nr:DUF2652 domain-containing protein [Anaerolineae bacterium]
MIKKGYFIITDISGYTAYLTQSELDHAYEILQSLYDAQIEMITPPMVISNFQGDAILSYIPEETFMQKQMVLEIVEKIYFAFTRKRELMAFNTNCTCNACKNINQLDLKIFIHYGQYLLQNLAGRQELVGSDVILAHRMMKNSVIEQTNIHAYALFTEMAANSLQLAQLCPDLKHYQDNYEHIGNVDMLVHCLQTEWKKEKAKSRNVVTKEEAWVSFEIDIDAPPAIVWDYLTKIDVKLEMLGFSEGGRTDDLGGRIGEESSFHCAHGEIEFRYQVIDWKPFEYFTCYETGPTGVVYDNTYHLFSTETGTILANYVRLPISGPESGSIEESQQVLQGIWNHAFPLVKPFIENRLVR